MVMANIFLFAFAAGTEASQTAEETSADLSHLSVHSMSLAAD